MNRHFTGAAFLPLLVIFLSPRAVAAGENTWTRKGPEGASVNRIAIDPTRPNTVYAATSGGLFRTDDGGEHWISAGRDLDGLFVSSLVPVRDSQTVYAGTSGGLFRSDDRGRTWSRIGPSVAVIGLALDPQRPETLYGVRNGTLEKSFDGGNVWLAAEAGIEGHPFEVVIDPGDSSTLYSVAWSPGTPSRMFKSTDAAMSWRTVLDSPICSDPHSVVVDPSRSSQIYVACSRDVVVRSSNAGESWEPAGHPGRYVRELTTGLDGANLYAITRAGVSRSGDRATTWETLLSDRTVQAVAASSGEPDAVYVGSATSVLRTVDGGETWIPANSGMRAVSVYGLASSPAIASTAYAATGNGLFRTADGGENWYEFGAGMSFQTTTAIEVDPAEASVLYAAARDYGSPAGSIYKSEDGGASWQRLANRFASVIEVHSRNRSTLYLGGYFGLAKSTDGGQNWRDVWRDTKGEYEAEIRTISLDPRDSGYDFAAGAGAFLLKSSSGEDSWSVEQLPSPDRYPRVSPSTVVRHPHNPGTVYVAATLYSDDGSVDPPLGRLYRTVDGRSWTSTPMPPGVTSLAIDPTEATILYASAHGGVFRSRDGGVTWGPFRVGLDGGVSALAVDRNGHTLYAGGAGIFTLRKSVCSPTLEDCPSAGDTVSFVPAVASARGAAGVRYSTTVRLRNSGESTTRVSLEFFPSSSVGLSNPVILKNVEIPPEDEIRIEDVVGEFFESRGTGAVRLRSSGPVIASGETAIDGVRSHGLTVAAESAGCTGGRISPLANDAIDGHGSRSNLGYFNPNPFAVGAALALERGDGSTLGEVYLQIPKYSQVQFPIFDLLYTVPADRRRLPMLSLQYHSVAPLLMYGVVIDGQSGGGTYLPAVCE